MFTLGLDIGLLMVKENKLDGWMMDAVKTL